MTTRALTDGEVRLLETALIARRRYRDRLFLVLALGAGFRVSELLSLDWRQLLSTTGEVALDVTIERAQLKGGVGARRKTIRSRRVPLTERVRGAIADYLGSLAAMPQGPVFRSRIGDNQAITRGQAHRQLKCMARELGLDAARVGCHSARKTFALQVHRAAHFDLVKTKRVMGHSSPVTTARYLETNQDELDSLVLSLGTAPAPAVPFVGTLGA